MIRENVNLENKVFPFGAAAYSKERQDIYPLALTPLHPPALDMAERIEELSPGCRLEIAI